MRGRQSPSWATRLRPQSTWQHQPPRNMRISFFHQQHGKVHGTVGQSGEDGCRTCQLSILTRECLCHITCRAGEWLGSQVMHLQLISHQPVRASRQPESQKVQPLSCKHLHPAHLPHLQLAGTLGSHWTRIISWLRGSPSIGPPLACSHEGQTRGDTTLYQLLLQSWAVRTVTCLGPKKAKS